MIEKLLQSSIIFAIKAMIGVVGAYIAVEAWVDNKVQATEFRVMTIRSLDMSHIDQRFNTLERGIYGKVITPVKEQFKEASK